MAGKMGRVQACLQASAIVMPKLPALTEQQVHLCSALLSPGFKTPGFTFRGVGTRGTFAFVHPAYLAYSPAKGFGHLLPVLVTSRI